MAWMRNIAAAAVGVGSIWLGPSLAAQTEEKFHTRLAPVSLDASMRANVAGTGSASAVLNGTKLTITGTFEGLRSPATVAHLHLSRVAGVRGPVVFDLTVSPATSGTISGSFDLSADQIESLKKGRFYIQIHSEKAPDGNLWGWLMH
jgi:CHRD domain-containing protein